MKIFNNSQVDKVKFGELAEEQAFEYENFHYIKMSIHIFITKEHGKLEYNAIALDPKISLETFKPDELVQPVNLVGVIDYET